MCDVEEMPVTSRYTNQQAVEDGVKVEILRWNGIPVTATASIRDDFGFSELLTIWHRFLAWKDNEEPKLPVEERLFSIVRNDRNVWVLEDGECFTILYPHEY